MMRTAPQERFMTHSIQKTNMVFESQTEKDTYELGVKTGMEAKPGDVYCLSGDLGTGKTVFTSGLAKGLGVETPICSPTFTILQTYEEGRLPLYHFDVYDKVNPSGTYDLYHDRKRSG